MRNYVLSQKEKHTLIVYLNQELKLNDLPYLMSRLQKKKRQILNVDMALVDAALEKFISEKQFRKEGH